MSIRLNKVLTELNIGLQTAVDFLKNKKSLGEIRDDANVNTKISDEQYGALVAQFKGDKDIKNEAEKMFAKKGKDKKAEKKSSSANGLVTQVPKFKPVGKIDLDNLGKQQVANKSAAHDGNAEQKTAAVSQSADNKPQQPSAPKPAVEPVAPKAEQKPVQKPAADAKPAVEPKPAAEQKPVVEPKPAPKSEPANKPEPKPTKPVAETPVESPAKSAEATSPASAGSSDSDNKIFTLKSEKKLAPKVNVLGKIDLSSLNQSTRPKKKSKEERKKEREEKAAQMHGEKKKRQRINKERVDIEAAANEGNNNGGGKKKKNKGGNNNNNGGGNNNNNGNNGNNGGGKKNKKNRQPKPIEVNEEDVARQVKETLARLTNKNQNKKGAKYRREKREAVQERLNEEMQEQAAESKTLKLTEFVTVSELATMMNVPVNKVIGTCMSVGIMVSINQRLDAETINLVADEFGFSTEYVSAEVSEAIQEAEDDENDLVPRAPIVTVMGHVDHGKTSLLDYVRKTNVIAGEAGGITQHIGAYNVKLSDGRRITFLDTPGHEAFTAMRARGTQVTDIAIIIIAADDSIMPTTKEAIAHAQAANVPMVFAINKIDKPGANPDKIREDLANMNLLVEEWGGKYQCQEISAKKGIGVHELMEKVLLEAEMLDLKANPNRKATGSVIESSLDKGRGYMSTVLVSNGTLKQGDIVIAGTAWGRIKAMFNERN